MAPNRSVRLLFVFVCVCVFVSVCLAADCIREAPTWAHPTRDAPPRFVEVAAPSGINITHGIARIPPKCIFDDGYYDYVYDSVKGYKNVKGGFCLIERSSAGSAVGDYNGDGLPDIYFPRLDGPCTLFRNEGDGTFKDVTMEAGVFHDNRGSGAQFVDVDQDGDLDLYVTTLQAKRYLLFINDGKGKFKEDALNRGSASLKGSVLTAGMSIGVGDYDLDGYPDFHLDEWRPDFLSQTNNRPVSNSKLLHNKGASKPGHFMDVTNRAGVAMEDLARDLLHKVKSTSPGGVYTFGSAFADVNNDRYPDLLVSGDFGTSCFFYNNKNGTFTEAIAEAGVGLEENGMGSALGDFNNDGQLDWFVTSIYDNSGRNKTRESAMFGTTGNRLYLNNNGKFLEVTDKYGVRDGQWAWGATFLDYNNDGFLDLFHTNGFVIPEHTYDDIWNVDPNLMFRSNGPDEKMTEVGAEVGLNSTLAGRAVMTFDYDLDGDMDLLVVNYAEKPSLFRNEGGNAKAWLKVDVRNKAGSPALGAKIRVTSDSVHGVQYREVGTGSHYLAQNDIVQHFGLGDTDEPVSVEVEFPTTMEKRVYSGVPVRSTLVVQESDTPNAKIEIFASSLERCALSKSMAKLYARKTAPAVAPIVVEKPKPKSNDSDRDAVPLQGDVAFCDSEGHCANAMLDVHTMLTSSVFPEDFDRMLKANDFPREYPNLDGSSHNKKFPFIGVANGALIRKEPANYSDGISEAMWDRPSPRIISNTICNQPSHVYSKGHLSDMFMIWGQFASHDTDHTTPIPNMKHESDLPIIVPPGDPFFDPKSLGDQMLRFKRGAWIHGTGTSPQNPRQQVNKVSAYYDASHIYGSNPARLKALRTFSNGMMNTTEEDLLPFNMPGLPNDNPLNRPVQSLFLTGDNRANIHPGLAAIHTVFVREHNLIAKRLGELHPSWSDEDIFQRARMIIRAEIQSITYNEYLPAMVNRSEPLGPYKGYDENVDPQVVNVYSTSTFRFGHSQVSERILRLFKGQHNSASRDPFPVKDAYFLPQLIKSGGVDAIVRGLVFGVTQEIDHLMVDGVRNFLFGRFEDGGLDLAALNIQRGRDHGIGTYNAVRKAYGLSEAKTFEDINPDPKVADLFRQSYKTVDDVDVWIGALAEPHKDGSNVGELLAVSILEQHERLRAGDRFWYENFLSTEEAHAIKNVKLSDIIRRTTGVKEVQDDVFVVPTQLAALEL